jgi:predicted O-methyltransferase YrrM
MNLNKLKGIFAFSNKTSSNIQDAQFVNISVIKDVIAFSKKTCVPRSNVRERYPYSMLSEEELVFLEIMSNLIVPYHGRIVELGAYVGGTSAVFASAMVDRKGVVEVYDMFEHNAASRRRLAGDPDYDEHSFYKTWCRNTEKYRGSIELHKGDFCKSNERSERADVVYVDIVKDESLLKPLTELFYKRMAPGCLLIHQDYFHWQSPWIVPQMEFLSDQFTLVGDLGFNMTVYVKNDVVDHDRISESAHLDRDVALKHFDKAISRYTHSKAGMLEVSRMSYLRNAVDAVELNRLADEIREKHSESPRVMRYLSAALEYANSSQPKTIW